MNTAAETASALRFGPDGLVPAVIQDATTDAVLMVGFMNEEAVAATRATNRVHFWSRSRGRLWRKGETSGHEQIVEAIFVNCEQNSLLVRVQQLGAVCHDGYASCYYRRWEPDGSLRPVAEPVFDPASVYQPDAVAPTSTAGQSLEASARNLYAAFAFLRDNDLAGVSGTSRLLRQGDDGVRHRVAGELQELAGVLDGTHRHTTPREDLLLEGTQSLYWVILSALRAGVAWNELRLDRALQTHDEAMEQDAVASLLRAEARRWGKEPLPDADHGATCHAAVALVGQACQGGGISPGELVRHELDALRQKPYLRPFFGQEG